MQYSIVTRASLLARRQTDLVVQALSEHHPDMEIGVTTVKTRGDHTLGPIYNLKKAFVGELEQSLLSGSADIAVHSLKDMSVFYQEGLCIAGVLKRGSVYDAMISLRYDRIEALPDGAKVGTCSARRAAQLRRLNPSLKIALCRGNVQTRLQKLSSGMYDALILAEVGLDRLGLRNCSDFIITLLNLEDFVPAGGQGAIAVQACANAPDLLLKLASINHAPSYREVMLEREIIRRFGGNCSTPLGVYVRSQALGYSVSLFLGDLFGHKAIKKTVFWPYQKEDYSAEVNHLVNSVTASGGQEILDGYQQDLAKVFDD